MKDLGAGRCANLVRYRVAGPGPVAADLKAAHRVLKRVARVRLYADGYSLLLYQRR